MWPQCGGFIVPEMRSTYSRRGGAAEGVRLNTISRQPRRVFSGVKTEV